MSDDSPNYNELLLAACQQDHEELLLEALNAPSGSLDLNYSDDLGFTALHWIAKSGSTSCLDIFTNLFTGKDAPANQRKYFGNAAAAANGLNANALASRTGDTPIHLAVRLSDDEDQPEDMISYIVSGLIELGGDVRIKNKNGQKPIDIVRQDKKNLREVLLSAQDVYALGFVASNTNGNGQIDDSTYDSD
ncbi:hypothetical protein GQ42DRAFT_163666 [Ramicandelaber brevisporus]|nr:hypothetical protein GQ42DRAFT_163666 [Ramicandelaber brevisporus]